MRNSVLSGRRLAYSVVLLQLAAAAVVAALWLLVGREQALGGLFGGLVAALGTAVFALRLFGQPGAPGGIVFARFAGATALKWLVVVVGLYLGMSNLHLPPLAVITGFSVGLSIFVIALRLKN